MWENFTKSYANAGYPLLQITFKLFYFRKGYDSHSFCFACVWAYLQAGIEVQVTSICYPYDNAICQLSVN